MAMKYFPIILFFLYLSPGYGFILDTKQQAAGNNQYLTLSQFYDEKQQLRHEVDGKFGLLASQIQQMFSSFKKEIAESSRNETRTKLMENIVDEHKKLLENYTKLRESFDYLQKKYDEQKQELVSLKNQTQKLAQNDAASKLMTTKCTNVNEAQQLDILAIKNKTLKLQTEITDLQALKNVQQVKDFHSLQTEVQSLSSHTQELRLHESARNQDFQALYNLTVTSQTLLNNRLQSLNKSIARLDGNQSLAVTNLFNQIQNSESQHNSTAQSLAKEIITLKKYSNKSINVLSNTIDAMKLNSNVSLAKINRKIDSLNVNVALTACVNSDSGIKPTGHILKFDDIRTQYGISNMSPFQTSGKFTCHTDGLYLVSVWVMSYNRDSEFIIYYNGQAIANGFISGYDGHAFSGTAVVAVQLSVNDTVWVQTTSGYQFYVYAGRRSCITIVKIN